MTQQGMNSTDDSGWGNQTPWLQPQPQPQDPYGRPGGPGERPPTTKRGTVIALAVAGGVVLAGVVVALALTLGGGGGTPGSTNTGGDTFPAATISPDGLGSDPVLDEYADNCYRGVMRDCDDLYFAADVGSAYEAYGDTCAGRQPAGTGVVCTRAFPD